MNSASKGRFKSGVAATLVMGLFPLGSAHSAWPGDNGRIAFQRQRDGIVSIWTMSRGGKDPVRVSRSSRSETDPSFSPNGEKIVFRRRVNKQTDIFVMKTSGLQVRRLTRRKRADLDPSWAPDGREIVYAREGRNGRIDLFLMGVDGSDKTRITRGGGKEFLPAWSSDGDRIAYIRGNTGLYMVDSNGSNRELVLDWAQSVDWAPGGDDVVVVGSGPEGEGIYTATETGGDVGLVASGALWLTPVWSPNGGRIIAQRQRFGSRGGRPGIYRMNLDGSGRKRIRKTAPLVFSNLDWQVR